MTSHKTNSKVLVIATTCTCMSSACNMAIRLKNYCRSIEESRNSMKITRVSWTLETNISNFPVLLANSLLRKVKVPKATSTRCPQSFVFWRHPSRGFLRSSTRSELMQKKTRWFMNGAVLVFLTFEQTSRMKKFDLSFELWGFNSTWPLTCERLPCC